MVNPGRSFKANLLWMKEWRGEKSRQRLRERVCKGRKSPGGSDLAVAAVVLLHSSIAFLSLCHSFSLSSLELVVLWLLKRPAFVWSQHAVPLWTRLTKPQLNWKKEWQKVSPARCFLSVQGDGHAWCVLLHKCVQECAMVFIGQQNSFPHWKKKCFRGWFHSEALSSPAFLSYL